MACCFTRYHASLFKAQWNGESTKVGDTYTQEKCKQNKLYNQL